METNSGRSFRLSYRLKLWKNKKMIVDTFSHKKMKILHFIQVSLWEKAYIKVTYQKGYWNDGFYNNIKDLKQAIAQFTEKDLVNEFCQKGM